MSHEERYDGEDNGGAMAWGLVVVVFYVLLIFGGLAIRGKAEALLEGTVVEAPSVETEPGG